MSEKDGIKFTEDEKKVGNLLKNLWKGFFWVLDKTFRVILWIVIIVGIHYALSIIAKRTVFLVTKPEVMGGALEPHKTTLYRMADWKIPPVIGPLLICIPTFLYKIYWNIRTFL